MADYLLDTNHVSAFLDGEESVISRVESARASRDRFGISMTILGELYFAAYASQRREVNLARLLGVLDEVIVWEYDHRAAEEFGRIQAEQKAKGLPIPSADAQIAAVARAHGLTVLSRDHHFSFVSGIRIENWLQT